ncbi:PREDICTED: uncharacterized protein LOC105853374 [Condylura cristata]|uniref:uncharacterized protein LOC105853374 n=1 Tax=Condylura cristata TaxID=143302 RepID=UPI00064325C4|nr:PREDICTED: uncharacterized protein LOC105853374 [Condylura cristata]
MDSPCPGAAPWGHPTDAPQALPPPKATDQNVSSGEAQLFSCCLVQRRARGCPGPAARPLSRLREAPQAAGLLLQLRGTGCSRASPALGSPVLLGRDFGAWTHLGVDLSLFRNPLVSHQRALWPPVAARAGRHVPCPVLFDTAAADLGTLLLVSRPLASLCPASLRHRLCWALLIPTGGHGALRALARCGPYTGGPRIGIRSGGVPPPVREHSRRVSPGTSNWTSDIETTLQFPKAAPFAACPPPSPSPGLCPLLRRLQVTFQSQRWSCPLGRGTGQEAGGQLGHTRALLCPEPQGRGSGPPGPAACAAALSQCVCFGPSSDHSGGPARVTFGSPPLATSWSLF